MGGFGGLAPDRLVSATTTLTRLAMPPGSTALLRTRSRAAGQLRLAVVVLSLLAGPATLLAQSDTGGQEVQRGYPAVARVLRAPPESLEQYVRTDSERYADPRLGTLYRFTRAGAPRLDVFVFPYADSGLAREPDGSMRAARELSDAFQASLPILKQRGYVDDYRFAFAADDSARVGNAWQRGRVVAVAVRRHGQVYVSLFYVYGLSDEMLKVRVDLPLAGWTQSTAPMWVRHLVAAMSGGR